jgi:hypothetical protein
VVSSRVRHPLGTSVRNAADIAVMRFRLVSAAHEGRGIHMAVRFVFNVTFVGRRRHPVGGVIAHAPLHNGKLTGAQPAAVVQATPCLRACWYAASTRRAKHARTRRLGGGDAHSAEEGRLSTECVTRYMRTYCTAALAGSSSLKSDAALSSAVAAAQSAAQSHHAGLRPRPPTRLRRRGHPSAWSTHHIAGLLRRYLPAASPQYAASPRGPGKSERGAASNGTRTLARTAPAPFAASMLMLPEGLRH